MDDDRNEKTDLSLPDGPLGSAIREAKEDGKATSVKVASALGHWMRKRSLHTPRSEDGKFKGTNLYYMSSISTP